MRYVRALQKTAVCAAVPLMFASVAQAGGNLIVNGDFESGPTGFNSSYELTPGGFTNPGQYGVAQDPSTSFTNPYASFGDHTSGSGNMLLFDGGSPQLTAWSEAVTLAPDTAYTFTMWAASADGDNPADLLVTANGAPLQSDWTLPGQAGAWSEFTANFDSGSGGSMLFAVTDINPNYLVAGNDFVLDDISVAAVPEPSSYAMFGLGLAALSVVVRRRSRPTR